MTGRFNLMTSVAIGLSALISVGACVGRTGDAADSRAGPATSGSGPAGGSRAATAGGTTDTSGMPDMDHSSMPGMVQDPRTAAPGGTLNAPAMPGMDHSSMAGMTPTPRTGTATGAMDHSAMQGMDHSSMAGMAGMTTPLPTGTALAASSPANGAMVQGSPGAISLTLPQPVTLQSVSLSNAVGQRIPLSAALPEGPVGTFTSPIPPLPAGSYTVAWTAGTGTRTLNGRFTFMVH